MCRNSRFVRILTSSFCALILIIFSFSFVKAESIKDELVFNEYNLKYFRSNDDCQYLKINITYIGAVKNRILHIVDIGTKKILYEGSGANNIFIGSRKNLSFEFKEGSFPLASSARVELQFSNTKGEDQSPNDEKNDLNGFSDFLKKMDDFKGFKKALNNFELACSRSNDRFINPAKKVKSVVNSVSIKKSKLPTIPFEFQGLNFNVFDLSVWVENGTVGLIRAVLSAILWVAFFLFILKSFVPKFKL